MEESTGVYFGDGYFIFLTLHYYYKGTYGSILGSYYAVDQTQSLIRVRTVLYYLSYIFVYTLFAIWGSHTVVLELFPIPKSVFVWAPDGVKANLTVSKMRPHR